MAADTALFKPAGDGTWLPAGLTRGPWDPRAQHGGAPAALVAGLVEAAEPGAEMRVARISFELVRPVPLAELSVDVDVVRPGRRAQVVEARVHAGDRLVVRATAVRVRRAPGAAPPVGMDDAPPPGPDQASPGHLEHIDGEASSFVHDGVEIRFVAGGFASGPATAWIRLRVPVVAGQPATPLQRVLAAADFGNGVSAVLDWERYVFINPDLTVYLEREPEGEWVALDARTRVAPDGTGVAESVLFDERGRIGRAAQALLVDQRP